MSGRDHAPRSEEGPALKRARLALVLAACTLALALLSPLTYRLSFSALGAMIVLGVAFLCGLGALCLALSVIASSRGARAGKSLAALALVIALAPLILPTFYGLRALAGGALLIHDITTDTDDPPAYVALYRAHRKEADYGGARLAAAQQRAYPDIGPLRLCAPPHEAFALALRATEAMGWDIAAASEEEGRIEATDTTRIYRFTDDIVIRIRAEGEGARIDIRSASRHGGGDLGTNARRIRRFVKTLHSLP
jgi:uncharacterized protein (DUF1499 family)